MSELLVLGTKTSWGRISAITNQGGERYYMMVKAGVVSLMPADVVEADVRTSDPAKARPHNQPQG